MNDFFHSHLIVRHKASELFRPLCKGMSDGYRERRYFMNDGL